MWYSLSTLPYTSFSLQNWTSSMEKTSPYCYLEVSSGKGDGLCMIVVWRTPPSVSKPATHTQLLSICLVFQVKYEGSLDSEESLRAEKERPKTDNQPTNKQEESSDVRNRRKLKSKTEKKEWELCLLETEKDGFRNKEWRTRKSFWKFKNIVVGK